MFSLTKIGKYLQDLILPSPPRATPIVVPSRRPKANELLTPAMVTRGDVYVLDMREN